MTQYPKFMTGTVDIINEQLVLRLQRTERERERACQESVHSPSKKKIASTLNKLVDNLFLLPIIKKKKLHDANTMLSYPEKQVN